jgi:hypothetical protein
LALAAQIHSPVVFETEDPGMEGRETIKKGTVAKYSHKRLLKKTKMGDLIMGIAPYLSAGNRSTSNITVYNYSSI